MRRWLYRLCALTIGLVAAALVAEAGARLMHIGAGKELLFPNVDGYPQDLYVTAQGIAYPNPAFAGKVSSLAYHTEPRFSAWGTRGAVPEGAATVVVGDSFTMALQVEDDETFVALLSVPAINAGVDGYSTWKATHRFAQIAATRPLTTAVLAFYLGNDFADNRMSIRPLGPSNLGNSPRPGGPPLAASDQKPLTRLSPAQRWFHDHSAVWAWFYVASKQRQTASGTDPTSRHFREELALYTERAPELIRGEMAATTEALTEFRDTALALGVRPVVLLIPPAFSLDAEVAATTLNAFGVPFRSVDLTTAHDTVQRVVAELGMTACSPRAALMQAERPYLQFDAHLSRRGHQVVAGVLQGCLTE